MKISIIQLSDLHIKASNEKLLNRVDAITNAIHLASSESKQIYVVYSGDLVDRGQSSQNVTTFILQIEENIRAKFPKILFKNIFVPGNHDCQFVPHDEVRQLVIDNLKGKDDASDQIIDHALSCQSSFWKFYEDQVGELPKNKLNYVITIPVSIEVDILFNCFNTSWMSTKNEKPGDLIFPISRIEKLKPIKNSISVSVFHHPLSWFSPNTELNNKKMFQNHIVERSNLVLTGHEHSSSASKVKDVYTELSAHFIEADSLNDGPNSSGFNILEIDLDQNVINLSRLKLDNNLYVVKDSSEFAIPTLKQTGFHLVKGYLDEIAKIPIPINHPNKKEITKWDMFIYPDLEPMDNDDTAQYIEASEILLNDSRFFLIHGDAQSGKTSLLQKLQADLNNINKPAVYLNAREIKGVDAHSYIKRALKRQFGQKDNALEKYISVPIENRIVLVDDIDKCSINLDQKKILFKRLSELFSKVIVVSSNENEVRSLIKTEQVYKDYTQFKILPLGKVKRNELIESWIRLGKEFDSAEELELTHVIQAQFDQVSELLGEQLIPPYPVFLLTLLQSLGTSINNFNIEQTSYAYCYQSLILVGLTKAGVGKENVGSIINFLSQFAYEIHRSGKKSMGRTKFETFYNNYGSRFIMKYSLQALLDILLISNIIIEEDDELQFSYKYLFYYLTAKKMATEVNSDVIAEVKRLCAELDVESNANIVIFLVHHTGHQDLINELLFHSMLPFDEITPITLNSDDSFFKFLNEFIKEISPEVIPRVTDHLENRKELLKREDDNDRKVKKSLKSASQADKDAQLDDEIKELVRVGKIIKILGQIVKNQQGSFEKEQLVNLVKESYLACFRSISHVSSVLQIAKPEIIAELVDEFEGRKDNQEIISRIKRMIHQIGYRFCLQSFANLGGSVGASKMDDIYDRVATEIGTPAAKLISFSIRSYFGKLNVSHLSDLLEDFQNNPVATDILRSRVRSYLYQHPVDYKKEQKISALCNFSVSAAKKLSFQEGKKR